MAFFDDLGKKLSNAGQKAVQKTKDMTDVVKLNGLISGEEKEINEYCHRIGKLYITLHSQDYEKEFSELVTSVLECQKKIDEYNQQIKDIKGILICEKCGAEIAGDAVYCNSCGTAVKRQQSPVPESSDTVKCRTCGNTVNKNAAFCTFCGTSTVQQTAAAPAPAVTPAPAPTSAAVPTADVNKATCPICGAPVDKGMSFCVFCGAAINPVTNTVKSEPIIVPAPAVMPAVKQPEEIKCPVCGKVSEPGLLFCTECGTKIQ